MMENPFEIKFSKSKIKTANQNAKRNQSNPGKTKSKNIEERKNSLAQEYLRKDKTNQFKDRRNGKKRKITTDDHSGDYEDDGHELTLTHKGQDVAEIDNHMNESEDDDDEENTLNESYTKQAHFGDGNNPVDQKTAVKNLIIESRKRKAEKAKEAEILLNMTHTLDQHWKTVIPIVKQLVTKEDEEYSKPDDYDRMMKEMIFERRGEPTKKLKPEDNINGQLSAAFEQSADDLGTEYQVEDVEDEEEEGSENEPEVVPEKKEPIIFTEDEKIVPKTYDEFHERIHGRAGISVKVRTWIRGLEAVPHTKQKNQASMLAFMLQYIDDAFDADQEMADAFKVYNVLLEFLKHITIQQPDLSIKCLKAIIVQKYELFQEKVVVTPGMDTMILFKLIFTLFPPDPNEKFKNPLHVSAFCFIGEIFSSCQLTTRSDISKSIFLVALVLAFAEETQRFLSQSLLLVYKLLFLCTSESFNSALTRNETKLLTVEAKPSKIKAYKMLPADLTATEIDAGFKLRCLSVLLSITTELTQLSASNIQFYAKHFAGILKNIAQNEKLPTKIKNQLSAAIEALANPTTAQRASLKYVAQEKKVPMLKMLEPKIERCFDTQPNMQQKDYYRQSDKQALTKKIKRERKGAIREIRKDNNFIAKMKLKNRMEGDRIRKEKVKQIFSHAANESHTYKKKKK